MARSHYDYFFRISVVGAPITGKSSLVKQFIFPDLFVTSTIEYIPTIGFDFSNKHICLDGNLLRIQIFDTFGVERVPSIAKASCKVSNGLIAVYDVCDAKSLSMLK